MRREDVTREWLQAIDTLEGQELEDAFAREVYGWTLSSGGFYWEGTFQWRDDPIRRVRKAQRNSWHPASSWGAFGHAVDDMCDMGYQVWLHVDGDSSECSVWAKNRFGGRDPLIRQLGGRNPRETALRAFIKAARVRAMDGEAR